MFYWDIIIFKFEGEIKEDIKDEDKLYCKELLKIIMKVEWAVIIRTLIWNNNDIWKITKDWLVILL